MLTKHNPATVLRVLMAENDINVNELAAKSKTSPITISRLRTGSTKQPCYRTARNIAKALGVKINTIWPNM